jgi:hypothetical protein
LYSLTSKIQTKIFNFLIAHCYKSFECDLCKKIIPEKIKIKNFVYNLINFQKPDNNYIALETVSNDINEAKYLYIIQMKNRTVVKLGRASDTDVKITDYSVSRNHAELKLIKGNFYLADCKSKFGTLVRAKNNFTIIPNKFLAIKFNKNYLTFEMKKNFISFITCYNPKKKKFNNYNEFLDNQQIEEYNSIQNMDITEEICEYESNSENLELTLTAVNNEMYHSSPVDYDFKGFQDKSKITNENKTEISAIICINDIDENLSKKLISPDSINKDKEKKVESIEQQNIISSSSPTIQLNININLCENKNKFLAFTPLNQSSSDLKNKNKVKNLVDNLLNLEKFERPKITPSVNCDGFDQDENKIEDISQNNSEYETIKEDENVREIKETLDVNESLQIKNRKIKKLLTVRNLDKETDSKKHSIKFLSDRVINVNFKEK